MPRRISLCFAITISVLVPATVIAAADKEGGHRADLLGVYQAALLNDPQLSAARHAFKGQSEAVPQAMSGLLPTISAGAKTEITRLDRDRPTWSGPVFLGAVCVARSR